MAEQAPPPIDIPRRKLRRLSVLPSRMVEIQLFSEMIGLLESAVIRVGRLCQFGLVILDSSFSQTPSAAFPGKFPPNP